MTDDATGILDTTLLSDVILLLVVKFDKPGHTYVYMYVSTVCVCGH